MILRTAHERPLTRPFIGRRNGRGRRLEECGDDSERRGWMFLSHGDCPQSADCLRVLDRNSPTDNDQWEMLGSDSRCQAINRIFDGGKVPGKFCREEDYRRSVKLNCFEQEAGRDVSAEIMHRVPLGAE